MSAATRFESARLSGDSEEARCAVEDMVRDAKDPAVRSSLAAQGAAVALAKELLNAAHAGRWCDSFSTDDSFCAQKNNSLVPFAPLARALRNLCAGDCVARGGAARAQAHEALKIALPALVELLLVDDQNQKLTDAIVASLQLACNLIAGGGVAGETSWRKLHPDAFSTVALLKGRAAHMTHPILCATMHARFGKVGQSAFDCDAVDGEISGSANDGNRNADDGASNAFATGKVCGFKACSGIWRPLLRASIAEERGTNMDNTKTGDTKTPNTKTSNTTSSTTEKQEFHAGGGVWLARFVKDSCLFQGDSLPVLCRGLAPNAESVALARDDKLRRKILGMALGDGAGDDATKDAEINESFGVEQATLLELVRRAIGETTETTDPPSLILSEGTLAFVLDLASRAGSFVEAARAKDNDEKDDQSQRDAALVTLRACLGILRAVTERDVKPVVVQTELDVATALSAMGMPRLLLGLLKSLPVPAGCGNTAKAEGPTKAPKLDAKTFKPIRVPKETADGTTTGTNGDDLTTGVPEESTGATSASEDFAADSNSGHDPFPSVRPWDGYRVDCLAPLANAMFGRPRVCDMVWRLGGTYVLGLSKIRQHTVYPYKD